MDVVAFFDSLISASKRGEAAGVCSVCSSNELVIEAALEEGKRQAKPVLIEATANQINQFGGYTGMMPEDFKGYVYGIADKVGFDKDLIILGGDHLGPLVWSSEPETSAMAKAEVLVAYFAKAGFGKIHLDCSMRLADDDVNAPLSVETVAKRAARLAAVVEANAAAPVVYVIGSEVPIPGGATETEDALSVTSPEDLLRQHETFRRCFEEAGLLDAWKRVIAIVVQPGVEFGDEQVFNYNREHAAALVAAAKNLPGIVLEGHSTDYQPQVCLDNMKKDGIAILKVGPALTFAAREALFALESIEKELYPYPPEGGYSCFSQIVEISMIEKPANWKKHYHGDVSTLLQKRRFSLSDRSRYYMEAPMVKASIARLFDNLDRKALPFGLLHQYLPKQAESAIASSMDLSPRRLVKENICYIIRTY